MERLDGAYLTLPEFTVERMKRSSEVCGVLTGWLLSLRTVCRIRQDSGVEDLQKELDNLRTTKAAVDDDADVDDWKRTVLPCDFTLTNIGEHFGDAVAEYCLMQILNRNRRAHEMITWQSEKKWYGQGQTTPAGPERTRAVRADERPRRGNLRRRQRHRRSHRRPAPRPLDAGCTSPKNPRRVHTPTGNG